jgi:glyoxylase-like metal-dependent hydrolase (beta-lactamase superfamily II)
MRKKLFWIFAAIVIIAAAVYYFVLSPYLSKMSEVRTYAIDKDLTIFIGGGGNSGILNGDNAVLVIDTKMAQPSQDLFDTAKSIAGSKPIIVVNTHIHPDHVSGNWFYQGSKIYAGGNYTPEIWKTQASENSMPTDWVKTSIEFKIGDETVTLYNLPYPAHTQSDLLVYLHKRKMLFTGDVVLNSQAPALMKKNQASIDGYLKAFDDIPKIFSITTIVPGHGHTGGSDLIDIFRQYFLDMKMASRDPMKSNELKKKYSDWVQVPMFMSHDKTIEYFKSDIR